MELTDGKTQENPSLGSISQGTNALFTPSTQDATNMLESMTLSIYIVENLNFNREAINTFFAKVE